MSLLEASHGNPIPLSTSNEDFLIREIVLTHDPDDRQLDSEMLLNLVESTFCYTTENVFDPQLDAIDTSNIDLTGSEEPISCIIYKISKEILCQCFEDENLHRKTLVLLEMLGRYRWDAKVVLALASFASSFGLFWLILQLQSDNALAVSLAIVKRLPRAIRMLKPKFKALNLLVNTMLKLTRFMISFEGMSLQHELVDDQAMDITKSKICISTYWIFRSILVCSSHIADLRNLSLERVYSDRTVIAAWGLHSLGNKLNRLCHGLGEYVDKCQQQIETRLYETLLHMFKENQADNQKALRTLFASQNEFPFKNSSRDKIGILELKSKIVLLLISKPDLLPIDKTFWLVQQTSDHRQQTSYAILWVPLPPTREWSLAEKTSFEFFSNRLPWFSIRRPWSLNSTVINYIKQEWNFKEDPMMVVLNENGIVTNSNAMDMVWIWGPKAFPFSASRERELWEHANWTIDLMINGINPLLSEWVKEGKNLCIYGSDNLDWIREFNATMKKIKSVGIQLEVVYVGCKNPGDENVKNIIDTIDEENLCTSMTFNKVHLFWFRLETIKRSIAHKDHTTTCDEIAAKVAELLEFNSNDGWAVIGRGSSRDVIKLDQRMLKQCLDLFPLWRQNVAEMDLVGSIRAALEPHVAGGTCQHNEEVIPYEEGLIGKTLICGSCKRPMDKFVLYKCEE